MDLAVLDLGSTSFHLLIARLSAGGQIQPLDHRRATLHLGAVVGRHGFFPPDVADLAVRTAVRLWRYAGRSGVDQPAAVATSALRDAANGHAVVSRIVAATGLDLWVLSGVEEAGLAYQGASARLPAGSRPRLVLDLGGGSLDLAGGCNDATPEWAASLPAGVSRLAGRHLHNGCWNRKARRALERGVTAALGPILDGARQYLGGGAIAVGGPFRALARVLLARRHQNGPGSINGAWLELGEFRVLRDELLGTSLATRLAIPGVRPRRALHLPVAAAVAVTTLDCLGLDRVQISDWGVREALLLNRAAACV
ncbi:MAG: Ppx/GppA phosphatase family protein [Egibacteraceae bacterium]